MILPGGMRLILLIALLAATAGLGLVGGLTYAILTSRQQSQLEERLRSFSPLPTSGLLARLEVAFSNTAAAAKLEQLLQQANIDMRPGPFFLLLLGATGLLTWFFAHILQLYTAISFMLAVFILGFGGRLLVAKRRQRFLAQLAAGLPDACRLLSSGLEAGLSLEQAFGLAAQEARAPANGLFRRLNQELQVGTRLVDVIQHSEKRVRSDDWRLLMATVLLQFEVGGNMAAALRSLASTLTLRQEVAQEVSGLTAETRYVALVLPFMPAVCAVMLNFAMPGFLNPLFTTPGLILLAVFVVLQIIGSLIIRRIADIRV